MFPAFALWLWKYLPTTTQAYLSIDSDLQKGLRPLLPVLVEKRSETLSETPFQVEELFLKIRS
jgi:hypothetical protein